MEKPKFVYVTYIAAPAEKVWEALTSTEWTQKYWTKLGIQSEWTVGADIRQKGAEGEVYWHGKILSSEPHHRYSFTFDDAPEGADPANQSRVTYELEPRGDTAVKLTVTHDNFPEDSKLYESISGGWPSVLSGLKTVLETGESRLLHQCNAG